MFSRWRSHTVISKLRGSRPYCSWTRGSGTRMMCCKDWWSLKRRLFSAAKTCPPQEQEVPSTVKREGIHCEKQGGAAKKNSTLRVSKTTVSDTSPQKQLGASLSLWETTPSLSLASPGPRGRDHCGRRIRLDRSRLPFPKNFRKRQRAAGWST